MRSRRPTLPPPCAHGNGIPDGPTERHKLLKENFLKQVPSISIHRARVITRIDKENPGLPKIELRAKPSAAAAKPRLWSFRTMNSLSAAPAAAPAWSLFPGHLLALAARRAGHHRPPSSGPLLCFEEDKKVLREEIFPYWEGKSVDEYCEAQYREAGVWELSGESFVSDCSYHALNGGGDSNPGYDVILMKKGMLDIQREAREHLGTSGL